MADAPTNPAADQCRESFILAGRACLIGILFGVQGWRLYPPLKHTDLIAMRQPMQTAGASYFAYTTQDTWAFIRNVCCKSTQRVRRGMRGLRR